MIISNEINWNKKIDKVFNVNKKYQKSYLATFTLTKPAGAEQCTGWL